MPRRSQTDQSTNSDLPQQSSQSIITSEASLEIVQTEKETRISIQGSESLVGSLAREFRRKPKGKTIWNWKIFSHNHFFSQNRARDVRTDVELNNMKGELNPNG